MCFAWQAFWPLTHSPVLCSWRDTPSGRRTTAARAVGHGQRHCDWVHGVEVQVRDPPDGVVVLLAQLGVVGLSKGLERRTARPECLSMVSQAAPGSVT